MELITELICLLLCVDEVKENKDEYRCLCMCSGVGVSRII
jgi:hypothetical protein